MIPSPLSVRPSALEQPRLEQATAELYDGTRDAEKVRAAVTEMRELPLPAVPQSDQQWAVLAQMCRHDRALAPLYSGLKMYVGGDAILTRLERGRSTTARVHSFDDSGAEFAEMMAGSVHPAGQLGPCPCDSGSRQLDCCLPALFDQPSPCGSGQTFTRAAGSRPQHAARWLASAAVSSTL